jgi:hypothetical protein
MVLKSLDSSLEPLSLLDGVSWTLEGLLDNILRFYKSDCYELLVSGKLAFYCFILNVLFY